MEVLNKYDKYLKDQATSLEADEVTRGLIQKYFQEEEIQERWNKILKEDYNYTIAKNENKAKEINAKSGRKSKRYVLAAIIGIAACLLLILLNPMSKDAVSSSPLDSLLAEHYSKPFTRDALKGPASTSQTRGEAYRFYQDKDYAAAIPLLEQVIQGEDTEEVDRFFLGLSYLYSQQPEAAIVHFKNILAQPMNQYKDAATWYLALALADAEQFMEAKLFFEEISKWTGNKGKTQLAEKAKNMLNVIDEELAN